MEINWFEITAQIINFFIILFILQKLLYKPVLKAMAERQEKIQILQSEADKKMEDAEKLIIEYNKKIADMGSEKRDILDAARQEAQRKGNDLLEDFKKEAENKRMAYLQEVEDEKENFIDNLKKNLGRGAVKIASDILSTISSKELEDEVFNTFMGNLKDLNSDIQNTGISAEENRLNLYSFRDLSQNEKQIIEDVLKEQIKNLEKIHYKVDRDLILGYELNLGSYTIHTNIKNYLNKIEKDIIKNLKAN